MGDEQPRADRTGQAGGEPYGGASSVPPGSNGEPARTDDYRGEFEQHTPGPQGGGQPGQVRARDTLRSALLARIAADPALAPLRIELEVGAQRVRLRGTIHDAKLRERLLGLVADAGLGTIDQELDVSPAAPASTHAATSRQSDA